MILLAGDFKNSGATITWGLLKAGKSALDAIEPGIHAVELNEDDETVGYGGVPNALGLVELDAGVMDGRTRASGAVGAVKGFKHPVSIAYEVMRRLPHVLLVGAGAERFAAEIGAERGDSLTDAMRARWREWCAERGLDPDQPDQALIESVYLGKDPKRSGGTTVYLAQDQNGDIAAATSTSGWAWKYPGRLGDSPVAGAGFYADNRYGAAACTGTGELSIRTSAARLTVHHLKTGMSVEEAVYATLQDINELPNIYGGITLYAIDARGGYCVRYLRGDSDHARKFMLAQAGDNTPTEHIAIAY